MVQKCRHNVKFADVFVPGYLITLLIVQYVKRTSSCLPAVFLEGQGEYRIVPLPSVPAPAAATLAALLRQKMCCPKVKRWFRSLYVRGTSVNIF